MRVLITFLSFGLFPGSVNIKIHHSFTLNRKKQTNRTEPEPIRPTKAPPIDSVEALHHQLFKSRKSHIDPAPRGRQTSKEFRHGDIHEDDEGESAGDCVDEVSTFARNASTRADFGIPPSALRRRIGAEHPAAQSRISQRTKQPPAADDHCGRSALQRRPLLGQKLKKIVFNGTFPIDDPYSSRFDDDVDDDEEYR